MRISYYSDEVRKNVRDNIAKYEWAKNARDGAAKKGDEIVSMGYEALWSLPTSQEMPRNNFVKYCPYCKGVSGFSVASPEHPWKVVCGDCGRLFPSNDFAGYYASSLDENGNFIYGSGDEKYLTNILYPEKGEKWGVDDGWAFTDTDGCAYAFAGLAAHSRWLKTLDLVDTLSKAYLYTGDGKYADAGIVLLDRIADLYPTLDIREMTVPRGFNHSHGGGGQGRIVGSIYETYFMPYYLRAYDAFYPAFESMSEGAVSFLRRVTRGRKKTPEDVRKNIVSGIVDQIYPAVKCGQIRGNSGMHQYVLVLAALITDDKEKSKEWIDFVFRNGITTCTEITGGNLSSIFINDIDRDGYGNEASPAYNDEWLGRYIGIAELLRGRAKDLSENAFDLYENVKFKKMFPSMARLIIADKFTPKIGDIGQAGNPMVLAKQGLLLAGYRVYKDPFLAQAVYFINGNKADGIRLDITQKDPESIAAEIESVVSKYGTFKTDSKNLTGYGLAVLQNETKKTDTKRNITSAALYYGRNIGHGHNDNLDLYLYSFGIDLSPDLGNPEHKDAYDLMRKYFITSPFAHNTVTIDRTRQSGVIVSKPLHYEDTDRVKLIDAAAPCAYPSAKEYRRTTALIRYDDTFSYAVDFFKVSGGKNHIYSFHAAESSSYDTEGLTLAAQTDSLGNYVGTLLSENVSWGGKEDPTGFQYFTKVRRSKESTDDFSVDWSIVDTYESSSFENVHLRLSMLGGYDKVTLTTGTPPRNRSRNPKELEYVFAENESDSGELVSLFTSVLEPYVNERFISSASLCPVTLPSGEAADKNVIRAVKLEFKNGRTDFVVFNSGSNETEYLIDGKHAFSGFFAVISSENGVISYFSSDASLVCGNAQKKGISGKLISFTKELSDENHLTVSLKSDISPDGLAGRFVYIETDAAKNAAYRILSALKNGDGAYDLFIGDVTLISRYKTNDLSDGFVYDAAPGADLYIPLGFSGNAGDRL